MPAIGYNEELAEVQRQRANRALDAMVMGGGSAAEDLASALDHLATGVADEAALWEKYKKKGWQSTKREMLAVAGRLRDLAKEIDKYGSVPAPAGQRDPGRGIEPGGDPNQEGVAPRAPIASPYAVNSMAENLAAQAMAAMPNGDLPPGIDIPDARAVEEHLARLEAERDGEEWPHDPDDAAAESQARTRAYLAGEIATLDAPLPTTAETPILDTVHTEALTMLEDRRAAAAADPFTDPLPPFSNPLASIEPITFDMLMTRQSVPADLRHWSYSQLSTLDECEVKYAADKIFQKPSLPQWALVGGSALHAAIEVIESRILAPGSAPENWGSPEEIWATAFQYEIDKTIEESRILPADWRASNKGAENYDWWRVSGADMVTLYVKQRIEGIEAATRAGVSPRRIFALTPPGSAPVPMLEHELSIDVPGPMGSLEFKSVIDQAWLCHDGTLLIVDIKSGRQMPSAFDTFQLGSQALVLTQHIGIKPPAPFVKACYYDARKGIFTTPIVALERHSLDELVYRMHTAEARRQGGIYRPHVSTFGCTGCGVRNLCPLMGGQ